MTSTRRIHVGDIQGCREELEMLLEKLRYDEAQDELLCCGDLVNRGPDSLGALRLLKRLGARGVLGNHDVHLLRLARGLRTGRRRDTLDAVLAAPDRDELLAWLESWPFIRAFPDRVLVHAGVSPAWSDPVARLSGLSPYEERVELAFATNVRLCDESGARPAEEPEHAAPPWRPWWRLWQAREGERRTVVYGHWAAAGLVVEDRVRGLDTGCVWGGHLSAWIAEEDRIVQVRARRAWQSLD
ncbi:MAG: hypothetical protein RL112_2258 [Planctomycetota bacterium]|jgi:bis(5'-nucleosyl)-tetraphosphatase (symmetrical)